MDDLKVLQKTWLSGILPTALSQFAEPGALRMQLNPKFDEGSMPHLDSPAGEAMNWILQALTGADPKSRYKMAMDGFGQLAGGLIVVNVDKDYEHTLVTKGDIYNKGKIGVIGGQGKDRNMGNTLFICLDETGEEIGTFPFDMTRMFKLCETDEWRTTDSRGHYWIRADFYVYLARQAEVDALAACYADHVKNTGGDPEIAGLRNYPRRQVLELIRDGRMGYFDQTQAFVMVALCLNFLNTAKMMAAGQPNASDKLCWQLARALAEDIFKKVTDLSKGDWRPKLDVDWFF